MQVSAGYSQEGRFKYQLLQELLKMLPPNLRWLHGTLHLRVKFFSELIKAEEFDFKIVIDSELIIGEQFIPYKQLKIVLWKSCNILFNWMVFESHVILIVQIQQAICQLLGVVRVTSTLHCFCSEWTLNFFCFCCMSEALSSLWAWTNASQVWKRFRRSKCRNTRESSRAYKNCCSPKNRLRTRWRSI